MFSKLYNEKLINKKSEVYKRAHMNSSLRKLNPYIDFDGILRVGGWLNRGDLHQDYKNLIIIPSRHHVAKLIVEFYHRKSRHQGRHITGGAVRSAGFWIVGSKRLISYFITIALRAENYGDMWSDRTWLICP